MGKVWLIAAREFRARVGSPVFLISTLIVLAAMVAVPLIGRVLTDNAPARRIDILDRTGQVHERLATALPGPADGPGPWLELVPVPAADLAAAQAQVRSGDLYLLVELTGAFPADVAATYHADLSRSSGAREAIQAALDHTVRGALVESTGLDAALAARMTLPVTTQIRPVQSAQQDASLFASQAGLGILAVVFCFLGLLMNTSTVFQGVLEEKTSRVIELMAGAARPMELMAGKIVGLGLLGLMQISLWSLPLVGVAIWRPDVLPIPITTLTLSFGAWLALFFLLGYVLYASLFAAAGAMISRVEDSGPVATPLIMLLVLPMGLVSQVLSDLSGPLARTLTFIPFTAPSTVMLRLAMSPPPLWEVVPAALLLFVTTIGAVWLSGRIYRAGMLAYGSRPTLRQLWRNLAG